MMKTLFTIFFTATLVLFFSMPSLYAANSRSDKLVGTWNITAQISSNVSYKNWTGIIQITKTGKNYSGTLDWSCAEGGWHIKQALTITRSNNNVSMQGTSLIIIQSPKPDSVYKLDNFSFILNDSTLQVTPSAFTDTNGQAATFVITKA